MRTFNPSFSQHRSDYNMLKPAKPLPPVTLEFADGLRTYIPTSRTCSSSRSATHFNHAASRLGLVSDTNTHWNDTARRLCEIHHAHTSTKDDPIAACSRSCSTMRPHQREAHISWSRTMDSFITAWRCTPRDHVKARVLLVSVKDVCVESLFTVQKLVPFREMDSSAWLATETDSLIYNLNPYSLAHQASQT